MLWTQETMADYESLYIHITMAICISNLSVLKQIYFLGSQGCGEKRNYTLYACKLILVVAPD